MQKYREVASTVTSPSVPNNPPIAQPQPLPQAAALDYDGLVRRMMQESGMNENFSRQCLSDFDFDFENALTQFMRLKEANKIPPEAWNT